MDNIPVVDFTAASLDKQSIAYDDADIKAVADQIKTAFSTIGFVYLKNFGITDFEVTKIRTSVSTFFELPENVKARYQRRSGENFGWVPPLLESLNPGTPGDLKETLNITPQYRGEWPDEEVRGLSGDITDFWQKCLNLTNRLLRLLTCVLGIDDLDFFIKCHHLDLASDTSNQSALRFLHYPPLTKELEKGQLRCGEHSDWGTLTLLFQDQVGGLQVLPRSGEWLDATPIEGTVLVNIGDMLQRWTSDMLKSTRHRVLAPPDDASSIGHVRQSMAFFAIPDDDCEISGLHGSKIYEPTTPKKYIAMKISEASY